MKKNIVQDVIPPKKSIRNVELPSRMRKNQPVEEVNVNAGFEKVESARKPRTIHKQTAEIRRPKEEKMEQSYKYEYDGPPKSSKRILYIAVGLFILALLFGISALFRSAEIRVTPKQDFKTLNETFVAKKDSTTGLAYQLVTITKDVEKTVDATSEQKVEKKATGRIIIYNNSGSQAQKLVATTRFETGEGLIFRLINNAVIPGRTIKDGKTIAGSLEVQVEADKSGELYNIGLKDFTVPGFKGDPKYTQVYARSKTIMSGGFSGMQKVVSKEIMDSVEAQLESELKESLSKDMISQVPANFALYENSITYKLEPVIQGNGANGVAVIKRKGVANAIIFDKGSLSRVIIAKVLPESTDNVVKIVNLDQLNFTFSTSEAFNPTTSSSVSFELKGEPHLVWVFDENKLKSDLLGLSKKSAKTVIRAYPNITEEWVEISPFWNQTIPNNPENVKLVNTLSQ
ncbi:MAG: hypothetical protein EXS47_00095 [Candidatus Zambryskibacteria bacterium]|nr:hypothetical protein [Candidatus Zambryskibacteria bacterium]